MVSSTLDNPADILRLLKFVSLHFTHDSFVQLIEINPNQFLNSKLSDEASPMVCQNHQYDSTLDEWASLFHTPIEHQNPHQTKRRSLHPTRRNHKAVVGIFLKKKEEERSSEPSNLSLSTYTSLHQASSSISHHLDDSKHNPAEEKYNKESAYRFPDRYETDVDVDVDTSISAPVYK